MARYDLESLLEDIKTNLIDTLNTKISAINSEKNDNMVLKTINDNAYALQSLNDRVMSYDPFVLYGVEEITSTPNGQYLESKYSINTVIVCADNGQDNSMSVRMLRYLRVLEDTFSNNFTNNQQMVKIEIQSLVPIELKFLNTSNSFRAVGVTIKAALAA